MRNNNKPLCPECGSRNSLATPSRAFFIKDRGQVMVYRCRSCGTVFNDITGKPPEGGEIEQPKEPSPEPKSPLEGLSEPDRLEKIKQLLDGGK